MYYYNNNSIIYFNIFYQISTDRTTTTEYSLVQKLIFLFLVVSLYLSIVVLALVDICLNIRYYLKHFRRKKVKIINVRRPQVLKKRTTHELVVKQ